MDNTPQNAFNFSSVVNGNIPTSTNPSYNLWRSSEDLNQSNIKGESSTKCANRLIVVLTTMLLFTTLASAALSVIAYRQVTAEHSQILSQLDQTNTMKFCTVQMLTQMDIGTICRNEIQLHCGPGEWKQVASLNMSDPSQQCPSAWREYNTNGVRACGRPVGTSGCWATTYSTGTIDL